MGKSYSEKVKSRSGKPNRSRHRSRPSSGDREEQPPFPFLPVIVIGVIIVLIAAGVLLYFYQGDNGSDDENTTTNGNGNTNNDNEPTGDGPGSILLDTTAGSEIFLDQYKGKVVVLDMFATWCQPCKTQMGELAELKTRFSTSELVILSVGTDLSESLQLITEFKTQEGADWTFAKSNEDFNIEFPATSIPPMFILDKQGNIAEQHVGVTSADILESDILSLL